MLGNRGGRSQWRKSRRVGRKGKERIRAEGEGKGDRNNVSGENLCKKKVWEGDWGLERLLGQGDKKNTNMEIKGMEQTSSLPMMRNITERYD